ncbi:protein translocase subunit SecF [Microlunatus ginsengisoli]|uniref:Protein-export membrane protein SecF n=1 Tax=Microlunatus ginsengisoli TaxID=363863 RepID=A0ABP6ZCZ0_9ACTN
MSKLSGIGHRLYVGEVSYDFIGHRRIWYTVSAALMVISIAAVAIFGLKWGIEFSGGADFQVSTTVTSTTVDDFRTAIENSGVPNLQDSTINTIGNNAVRVQTRTLDPTQEVPKVRSAIAEEAGTTSENVAYSLIGASWGGQITQKALIALGVFLVLVTLVIWAYFRNGKMSAAALIALGHDLVLTVGIYALVGFTVTPATLIGVLTILGYSLYDTVVVFDKVRENTRDIKSSTTRTYGEAANLAVNQVLVRSINTTIIGVLPVAALLFAGAFILGEGPLKDLALALFVGMISGAYSSIFIATPLLVQMKEREPDMQKLSHRVANRRAREASKIGTGGAEGTRKGTKRAATTSTAATSVATLDPDDESDEDEDRSEPDRFGEPEGVGEPSVKVSVQKATDPPPITVTRPTGDGAARRPQPQHKPRSQRKK